MRSETSPDYVAVRHVLTSPAIAARTAPYIGAGDFDWGGLLAETASMSGGERVLVRVAHDLWEGAAGVGTREIVQRLDRGNFERVLEALVILRDGAPRTLREAA